MKEAEIKFWMCPELLETLLPFLDAPATKCLAEIHPLFLDIVQGVTVWNKLIKRCFPADSKRQTYPEEEEEEETLKAMVESFGLILKMADATKSPQLESNLLHIICSRFPSFSAMVPQYVELYCSCHNTHSVSQFGFILLETVESILGTTEQILKTANVGSATDMIEGLSSRATRQQQEFKVYCRAIWLSTTDQAKAFSHLVKKGMLVNLHVVGVEEGIGKEGWKEIRRGVEDIFTRPYRRLFKIISEREAMLEGERRDLRGIWEGMARWVHGPGWDQGARYYWEVRPFGEICVSEKNWVNIEQLLDMTEEEWDEHNEDDDSEEELEVGE